MRKDRTNRKDGIGRLMDKWGTKCHILETQFKNLLLTYDYLASEASILNH